MGDISATPIPLRSLGFDVLSLSASPAPTTLRRKAPHSILDGMFAEATTWDWEEVKADEDDPATSVMKNQERLREHSAKNSSWNPIESPVGKSADSGLQSNLLSSNAQSEEVDEAMNQSLAFLSALEHNDKGEFQ